VLELLFEAFAALLKATLAIGCLWFTLRALDKSCGVSFGRDILPELRKGNRAVAAYYGRRFLGAAILYAAVWFVPI